MTLINLNLSLYLTTFITIISFITTSPSKTIPRYDTVIIECQETLQNVTVSGHLIIKGQLLAQNVAINPSGRITLDKHARLIITNNLVMNGVIDSPHGQARVDAAFITLNSYSTIMGTTDINGMIYNNKAIMSRLSTINKDVVIPKSDCVRGTHVYP